MDEGVSGVVLAAKCLFVAMPAASRLRGPVGALDSSIFVASIHQYLWWMEWMGWIGLIFLQKIGRDPNRQERPIVSFRSLNSVACCGEERPPSFLKLCE